MPCLRIILLTAVAMGALAGNFLLCRAALNHTASSTTVRLLAGATVLWPLVQLRGGCHPGRGNRRSAWALFAYAAGLSLACVDLPAATGVLLLFGAVRITMIGRGPRSGARLRQPQLVCLLLAFAAVVDLLLSGLSAPPLPPALLMLGAGVAWGVCSLRHRGRGSALQVTADISRRAQPIALALSVLIFSRLSLDRVGIDYAVRPARQATHAAALQLSLPLLTALGGVLLLGELLTVRLARVSVAILGGGALVILEQGKTRHR